MRPRHKRGRPRFLLDPDERPSRDAANLQAWLECVPDLWCSVGNRTFKDVGMMGKGRMGLRTQAVVLLLAVCGAAFAQPWRSPDGDASPVSEARKEVDGFSAMLLVTPDLDWAEKWDTPPDVIPHFREADQVERGEKLAILIFFANPLVVDGKVDAAVDLRVTQPDGNAQIDAPDASCYSGAFAANPSNVMLCETSLGYSADPDDLSGEWSVDVVVKDRHRKVEIPLRTSFRVLD